MLVKVLKMNLIEHVEQKNEYLAYIVDLSFIFQ